VVPSGNAATFVACLAEPPIDLHGPVRRAFSAFWQRPDRALLATLILIVLFFAGSCRPKHSATANL